MTLFSAIRIGLVSAKLSHIPSLMDKPALRSYIEDDFGLQEALCAMEFSVTSSAVVSFVSPSAEAPFLPAAALAKLKEGRTLGAVLAALGSWLGAFGEVGTDGAAAGV